MPVSTASKVNQSTFASCVDRPGREEQDKQDAGSFIKVVPQTLRQDVCEVMGDINWIGLDIWFSRSKSPAQNGTAGGHGKWSVSKNGHAPYALCLLVLLPCRRESEHVHKFHYDKT